MNLVLGILALAFTVAVAVAVLLSFQFTRNAVGLGNVTPTGVPGWVAGKIGTAAAA